MFYKPVSTPASEYNDLADPLLTFPWPGTSRITTQPRWNGSSFQVGNSLVQFLSYSVASSAWSKDLTEMHETEATTTHPIDVASRLLAIDSMKLLRGNPVILDVGCSSGLLIEELRRQLPGAAIIGADYLPDIVARTSERIRGVPFIQFDLRNCPLPDRCIEGVTALNVLEHIDDDFQALRELHRILKPGGMAHIEVPVGPACYDLYDEVLMHYRRYRLSELQKKCQLAGFSIERATHLGFLLYPAFWAVKKKNRLRNKNLDLFKKRDIVVRQIKATDRNWLLEELFRFEMRLGRLFAFPIGIRAVLRLKRTSI